MLGIEGLQLYYPFPLDGQDRVIHYTLKSLQRGGETMGETSSQYSTVKREIGIGIGIEIGIESEIETQVRIEI